MPLPTVVADSEFYDCKDWAEAVERKQNIKKLEKDLEDTRLKNDKMKK